MSRSSTLKIRGAGQDTPDRRTTGFRLGVALAVAALGIAGCANPPTDAWTPERLLVAERLEAQLAKTAEPTSDGSLRVRLAFGEAADLDLFVTDLDPRVSETVYFAKHETRAGGRLLGDARCGDPLPRTDAVLYDAPHTGGYRIGVDYHRSCGDVPDITVFSVFVVEWTSGERRETRRGIARSGHFDDRFWMLDTDAIEGPAATAAPAASSD